ncbi:MULTISPECIES: hypothetical protein [Salibacterium]|uniref:Uncharacterized protein n=2 Tax=Salibacterium TaxID=1884429 RepID=A0A1I4N683_9BACI|nr:hypothetical protein [Salibacterium qingdaonense]SFM10988.1 hypothetical protein SAMN04488054_11555 [Salibacterium qingdaonense]
MKKYLVFIVSFGLLYVVFQILSGTILTSMFTPDFSSGGSFSSQEITFGTRLGSFPIMMGLLIATSAYFISNKVANFK